MIKKTILFLVLTCAILPLSAYSSTIDDMNILTGWSSSADGGATITLSSLLAHTDKGLKATYDLTSGNWVNFGKTSFGNSNFGGGDSLRLTYRGSGDNNNIELKMTDEDGDEFVEVLENASYTGDVWTTKIISLDNFEIWGGLPARNNVKNWDKIVKYHIGITKATGGTGTLEIDRLESYQSTTPDNKIIDECKAGPTATQGLGFAALQSVTKALESTNPSPDAVSNPGVGADNHYYITYKSTALADNNYIICAGETLAPAVSSTTYTYLNFYMKLGTGEEKLHLELVSTGGGANLRPTLSAAGADYIVTTEWQFFSIPITKFGIIPGDINEIKWVADPTDLVTNITRSIYLDRIWLSKSQIAKIGSGSVATLNDYDGLINKFTYTTAFDKDAVLAISSVDGILNKAIHYDYNFNQGEWMICEKGTGINAALDKGFRFWYMGTGVANNLEFKVKDRNNVEYIKKFFNITNTNGVWKQATVLNTDFTLFAKGVNNNDRLDLKNIAAINFAISKSATAGSGTFFIDELESISDKDFDILRPGKIINAVTIDNNPFSPNGDGVKDLATFSYTLTDYAHIWLDIYNMAGEYVRKIDVGEQVPGTYASLQWDGKDDGGSLVNNGLYFYKLRAKNPDNQSDFLTHVIAVIK